MSGPTPPISTPERVRQLAASQGHAAFLIGGGREVTYGRLLKDMRQITAAMQDFALAPGRLVAVHCPDFYLHWLLLLACEELGLVTASLTEMPSAGGRRILERADLVLGSRPLADCPAHKFHLLEQSWISRAGKPPASDRPPLSALPPTAPLRLVSTSGTTGQSKLLLRGRLAQQLWMDNIAGRLGANRRSRYLVANNFAIQTIHVTANAFLRAGATLIQSDALPLGMQIETYAPNCVSLLPAQLSALLSHWRDDAERPRGLTIAVYGGRLFGTALHDASLETLADRVLETYGTNEVGPVSMVQPDGVSQPIPGVAVEVVDESGAPVPAGRPGRLRVRTPWMTDGYLDDPAASAAMFPDGWFHPGDEAVLTGDGGLKIVGRADHLLNLGGVKHDPSRFEQQLRQIAGIEDAAMLTMTGQDGQDLVAIAIVTAPGVDWSSLPITLPKELSELSEIVAFRVLPVPRIPRTETGKVQPHLLRGMITL